MFLLRRVNGCTRKHADFFWCALLHAEEFLSHKYAADPLVLAQLRTRRNELSAFSLQVQLCEYRRFRNQLAKMKAKERQGAGHLSGIDEEEDQLDFAPALRDDSRLACQCVPDGSEDVEVELPEWNRNEVSEEPH